MSRTYASINNNLEDKLTLNLTPTPGTTIKNGDKIVLFHEDPILNCDGLAGWSDKVEGATALTFFDKEFAISSDNQEYTDWAELTPDALASVQASPDYPLWLRFRYTRRGVDGKPLTLLHVSVAGTRTFATAEGVVRLADEKTVVLAPADSYKVFKLEKVNIYIKDVPTGTEVVAMFRYSGDGGRSWAPWTPLNDDNVRATRFNTIRFSKFEFAFTKRGPGTPTIFDVELVGDFQNVSCANRSTARIGLKTQCAPGVSCAADGNPMNWRPSEKECDTANKFDPYQNGSVVGFQNYLANSVAKQWGHSVEYYRVDTDVKGTDVLLHEHQLYNVIEMKMLEAVVPDNIFIDAADTKNTGFDNALFSQFEVHITKDRFKQMFGLEYRPGTNDIVYFCKINRLFVVEKTIAHRAGFNAATFYKVVLKNYNSKANVNKKSATQEVQDKLLTYTKNSTLDDLMGPQASSEQSKAAKVQQFKPLSKITGITLAATVAAKMSNLYNSSVVVSESMYVIPVPLGSSDQAAVSYGHIDSEMGKGDNRAVSLWFNVGAKYDKSWSFNLFDNSENVFGYQLRLHDGKLKFTLNGTEFALDASEVEPDTWFCALANLDQRMQKLELCLYSRGSENAQRLKTSALMLRSGIQHDIVAQSFAHGAQAKLGICTQPTRRRTEFYVTNLRLYKQVIQDDARDKVLNQHIVKDADLLIFADNGEAKIIVPEMGNNGI